MSTLRVISGGLLTTVQDLGRPGWAHLGVSASGAADALALRAANLLVGNAENAAALEMTLAGGTFEFDSPAVVALAGGDFECNLPLWSAASLKPGEAVRCGAARSGARCCLAVRGGIAAPAVLGSRSTHLFTGLGGWQGRALRRGDVLPIGDDAVRLPRLAAVRPPPLDTGVLRATDGPQHDAVQGPFYGAVYQVSPDSDRMGIRLRGAPLQAAGGGMLTEGVPLGAVQVPPDGAPIVLFVEHQTTGGYPKIASVVSADFTRLGQLRPGARVSFERVTLETAIQLLRAQEEWLHELV